MTSRLSSFQRILKLSFSESRALFLLGPRKVGKTTFLSQHFPKAIKFDLLKSEIRRRFQLNPAELRHQVLENPGQTYIIDEVQKIPELLEEVHWLLENTEARFVLCGSSARKLKRGASNLLGGRAFKIDLFPLVYPEFKKSHIEFNLTQSLNQGQIPQHYLAKKYQPFLKAYIDLYLQEEIIEESRIRKLNSFQKFLEVAALMNGELLNYANVGSSCGVSTKTVREYYQILEDTLIGFTLEPWTKVKTRALIETSKFYLFDTGVIRALKGIDYVAPKTSDFGSLFETYMVNEVRAYLSYKSSSLRMYFWRTKSQFEVDLIIGPMIAAIEFKSAEDIARQQTRSLTALLEEHKPQHSLIVCQATESKKLENGIRILPYQKFLELLWRGEFF